jgi:predicted AAA+ superfamily ATPase
VLRVTGDREAYFWNTQGGAELDLLVFVRGSRYGFEFKYADAPSVTKGLRVAREDLKLRRAFLVHPGARSYPLEEWAEAVAIGDLSDRLWALVGPSRRRG